MTRTSLNVPDRFPRCSMLEEGADSPRLRRGLVRPTGRPALQQCFHLSDYQPRAALLAQKPRPTPPGPNSVAKPSGRRCGWSARTARCQVPTTWTPPDLGQRSTPARHRQYALVAAVKGVIASRQIATFARSCLVPESRQRQSSRHVNSRLAGWTGACST